MKRATALWTAPVLWRFLCSTQIPSDLSKTDAPDPTIQLIFPSFSASCGVIFSRSHMQMAVLQLRLITTGLLAVLSGPLHAQLSDVTQPGDPIVATSINSPASEGVANAIDNQSTK
ncbi:MAG: hypothetical protein L0Z53_05715, partial [Acidobacteriales bacterium]|nr:hypothetical protein [Terriglobales bacterium]